MNNKELEKIWKALDTRITTLNERTKNHTAELRELNKRIKELEQNGR